MNVNELFEREAEQYGILRELYVPEWEMTVYAKARFTLDMMKPLRRFAEESNPEALAEAIVRYALNEDGSRIFTREHKTKIMRYMDSSVVAKVGGWIMGNDDEGEEEPQSESLYSSSVTDGAELPPKSNGQSHTKNSKKSQRL